MKNKLIGRLLSLVFIICLMFSSVLMMDFNVNAVEIKADMNAFAPVFDAGYYLARYPELASSCGSNPEALFNHFITVGMNEGRQASPKFNVLVYIRENEDLRKAFGRSLSSYYFHYASRGYKEGRVASSDETLTYYDYYKDYFSNTVFVGDSIMLGFRNYCSKQFDSEFSKIKFLCAGSYSVNNALKPVTDTALHPMYKGQKVSVWDGINKMQAKHVYIMFGTNDLAITGVDGTISNYVTLIDNIKRQNPDVDINIISMTYTVEGYAGKKLNNDNIRLFNQKLNELCQLNGYNYVDIASVLDDGNGNLKAGYCSDGFVHLNMSCYQQTWEPVIKASLFKSIVGK